MSERVDSSSVVLCIMNQMEKNNRGLVLDNLSTGRGPDLSRSSFSADDTRNRLFGDRRIVPTEKFPETAVPDQTQGQPESFL